MSDRQWLTTAETQVLGLLLKHGISANSIEPKPERFRDKLLSRAFASMVELGRPADVNAMRARADESELWQLCVQLAHRAPDVDDVNDAIKVLVARVRGRNEALPSIGLAGMPVAPESESRSPSRPGTWRDQLMDPQLLCDQRFSEVKYVVPELIPEGVTLLDGAKTAICETAHIVGVGTGPVSLCTYQHLLPSVHHQVRERR
jgi:hypothetical protein